MIDMKNFFATVCAVSLLAGCSCGHKVSEGTNSSIASNPDIEALSPAEQGIANELVNNVGDRVFFAFDRSKLSSQSKMTLDKQYDFIQKYSSVDFVIEGHADERGTREYNIGLGERRANSAKQYLVSKGVQPNRLGTVSYGKEKPAVEEHTPEAWAKNRRAVLTVAPK